MVCLQSKYKYGHVTGNIQVILLKKYVASALYYLPSVCFFCTYLLKINNVPFWSIALLEQFKDSLHISVKME